MGRCVSCDAVGPLISEAFGACGACLQRGEKKALAEVAKRRAVVREGLGLPAEPPRDGKVLCTACANRCRIPEGQKGFCGLRLCRDGDLVTLAGGAKAGLVDWYNDCIPTNCVGAWVCPANGKAGYPKYTSHKGLERGCKNLAVFYEACSFDCVYCQNESFRRTDPESFPTRSAAALAAALGEKHTCICFFGGDPSPQMAHAVKAGRLARQHADGRPLRICFETNGSMARKDLTAALDLALSSGGSIKFDLKCWTETLHLALTGVSGNATRLNFRVAAGWAGKRPDPPLVLAATTLVPGYVTDREVGQIARFIAEIDPHIPYSLLAFHPADRMKDLPVTSRAEGEACRKAARAAGLKRVRLGNVHLLD